MTPRTVSVARHRASHATLAPIISAAFTVLLVGALIALQEKVCAALDHPADNIPSIRIVIHKGDQILELLKNGAVAARYRVCLGINPSGPKKITGDRKTPEGEYFICYKSAESSFHRFLGISYPGPQDAEAAFREGVISKDERDRIVNRARNGQGPPWDTKLGGWVGIHGYPTEEYRRRWIALYYPKPHNWTDGCIAVWNFEIEDLYARVPLGAPVTILP